MRKQRHRATESFRERKGQREIDKARARQAETENLKKENKMPNKTHLLGPRTITADFWGDMSGTPHSVP